jgi:hypothetical protein
MGAFIEARRRPSTTLLGVLAFSLYSPNRRVHSFSLPSSSAVLATLAFDSTSYVMAFSLRFSLRFVSGEAGGEASSAAKALAVATILLTEDEGAGPPPRSIFPVGRTTVTVAGLAKVDLGDR